MTSTLHAHPLPMVVVLATGGTIASQQNLIQGTSGPSRSGTRPWTVFSPQANFSDLFKEPRTSAAAILRRRSGSSWLRARNELLSQPDVNGIVVTHGTDTLEESAYFLDLTIPSAKPVVFVGSQRPASDSDSDGRRNLLDAVRVALSPDAAGKGVRVVFNGQINAARDVTKTHTSRVETFRSLEFGELGIADSEVVRVLTVRRSAARPFPSMRRHSLAAWRLSWSAHAGADGRLIRSLIREEGLAGLGRGWPRPRQCSHSFCRRDRRGSRQRGARGDRHARSFWPRLSLSGGKSSAIGLKQMGCVLSGQPQPAKGPGATDARSNKNPRPG